MKVEWRENQAIVRDGAGGILFAFDPLRDIVSIVRRGQRHDIDLDALRREASLKTSSLDNGRCKP